MAVKSAVAQTMGEASGSSAPEFACAVTGAGVSAVPRRFMKADMARRETRSSGQYPLAVQPKVTARLRSHSTFGQKAESDPRSMKPEHSTITTTGVGA